MIVHHFNTLLEGGAAMAARRLHESLCNYGITSKFYYAPPADGKAHASYRQFHQQVPAFSLSQRVVDRLNGKYYYRKNFQRMLNHYLDNRPSRYELFSYDRLPFPTLPDFSEERPDIIHLHWISGLIDFPSFFHAIPNDLPVVWTLHDMHPFTGGCHYSWECENYRQECGRCPQLNLHRSPEDLSHQNWQIKWQAIKGKNIHIVGNSHWLEERSKESKLFSGAKSFRTIHYGLDTTSLLPKNKSECRKLLGLKNDAFVLSFGASSIDNHRKGLEQLIEALRSLQDITLVLLIFGHGRFDIEENSRNPEVKHLGRIDSQDLLSIVYCASDIFVMPSLQEAFGQTALEAMACGVPVVAYKVGGIPEIVREGSTGILASPAEPKMLADAIRWMFEHPPERDQMGIASRKIVETDFSLDLQASKYCELYHSIIN